MTGGGDYGMTGGGDCGMTGGGDYGMTGGGDCGMTGGGKCGMTEFVRGCYYFLTEVAVPRHSGISAPSSFRNFALAKYPESKQRLLSHLESARYRYLRAV